MKILALVLTSALGISSCSAVQEKVTSAYTSIMNIESHKDNVRVSLVLREVGGLQRMQSSPCTGSRTPCRIIDEMKVLVDGSPLHVPGSVFRDLSDIRSGEISSAKGDDFLLVLHGGDASEAYMVVIRFDKERIKQRTLASSLIEDQPLEETMYNEVELGD